MITDVVQFWERGRPRYRPAREPINTALFEVAPIPDDATAKKFVVEQHYSGSYPNARYRFGLYQGSWLVGVAVFSHPQNDAVFDRLPCDHEESIELGRLVLLNEIGSNAESWMIARCFDLLRAEGIRGIVSFADPVRRTTASGEVVMPGHVGLIYQASNAVYTGRSKREKKLILPDGTCFCSRAAAKIRARDSRWRSAMKPLVRAGAEPLTETEDARAWVDRWVGKLCRPIMHGGNHRYLFGLDKATKKALPPSLPYPKMIAGEPALAA